MKIVAGGKEYQLAPLKYADVRDLGRAGFVKNLARLGAIEGWELDDTVAEVVATSIRRAGGAVTARELLESADPGDRDAFIAAVSEILAASGFHKGSGGGDPNAPSPGTGAGT